MTINQIMEITIRNGNTNRGVLYIIKSKKPNANIKRSYVANYRKKMRRISDFILSNKEAEQLSNEIFFNKK